MGIIIFVGGVHRLTIKTSNVIGDVVIYRTTSTDVE